MTPSQLRPPSVATLKKYGLTAEMWYTFLDLQDGKCPICQREFSEQLRPVIDHFHARGFRKMKAEKRVKHVRGLTCAYCNLRRLPKGSSNLSATEIAYNIYIYLADYDAWSGE